MAPLADVVLFYFAGPTVINVAGTAWFAGVAILGLLAGTIAMIRFGPSRLGGGKRVGGPSIRSAS